MVKVQMPYVPSYCKLPAFTTAGRPRLFPCYKGNLSSISSGGKENEKPRISSRDSFFKQQIKESHVTLSYVYSTSIFRCFKGLKEALIKAITKPY
jgi:hypothetical protein